MIDNMELKGLNGFAIVLVGAALIALGGCKKKEEAPVPPPGEAKVEGALPDGHPPMEEEIARAQHAAIKTQKEVDISPDVAKKWKEVKIEITDTSAQRTEVATLKVGQTVMLTKDGYNLKVEIFVPDYAISDSKIISRSNEAKNPAVLVDLFEGEKSVARGWVFKDFPEFNSYHNQRFNIVLIAPAAEKK